MTALTKDPQTTGRRTSPALAGLHGLQAWVWTASALPKLTSGAFLTGFARFVGTAPPMRPALYGHLVTPILLAAPWLFALGALVTEVGLAATFIVATVAMLGRRDSAPRAILVAGTIASVVAAGFALNLALLVGDAAPWRLGDPFDGGVALEYLLVGLALVTAASSISALAARSRARLRPAPAPRPVLPQPVRRG
jgi:hypothetical protein